MNTKKLLQLSDIELVRLVQDGSSRAYAELWKRHAQAVIIATRNFTGFDPDDVAQETFLRILTQIQAGGGPKTAFRAYAIMTARNVAKNMARNKNSTDVTGVDEDVFEEASQPVEDSSSQVISDLFTRQIFTSLPIRWQEVLWYREVEDLPVKEVSLYLGVSDNATSALLKRAKEGFKQAWIAASLEPMSSLTAECEWVVDKLPQLLRGKTTPIMKRKMKHHFQACARCADLSKNAARVQSQLAAALLPGLLGGVGAAKYLLGIQPASALAHAGILTHTASSGLFTSPVEMVLQACETVRSLVSLVAVATVGSLGISLLVSVMPANDTQTLSPEELDIGPVIIAPPQHDMNSGRSQNDAPNEGSGEYSEGGSDAEADLSDTAGVDKDFHAQGSLASELDGDTPHRDDVDQAMNTDVVKPVPLSGAPIDGIEVGIFPRLSGISTPGSTIYLYLSNEAGQTSSTKIFADAQGRWVYTADKLMGEVTVKGRQEYVIDGQKFIDAEVIVGTYSVRHGLTIQVDAVSTEETTIRVSGLVGETKNQVVNVTSTLKGVLAHHQRATAPGEVTITVPYTRSDLGDLYYWQGATSEGPRRVWWRTL